jgi:hypothetical protein
LIATRTAILYLPECDAKHLALELVMAGQLQRDPAINAARAASATASGVIAKCL